MKHPVYNIFLVGVGLLVLISDVYGSPAGEIKRGNRYYTEGKFDQAAELYEKVLGRDPNLPEANYNLATALYKKGEYDRSIEYYQKALLSDGQELVNKAQFNLGNAYFKKSESLENDDVDAAIAALEKGIGYYDKASPRAQKDKDLKQNYKIFKNKLEELKKKRDKAKTKGDGDGELEGNEGPQGSQSSGGGKDSDQPKDGNKGQNNPENNPGQSNNAPDNSNKSGQNDNQNNQQGQGQQGEGQGDSGSENNQNQSPQPQGSPSANGQSDSPSENGSQVGSSAANQGAMTPQEAQMMLNDYQRNEEPKGMLYFKPQSDSSNPAVKDW